MSLKKQPGQVPGTRTIPPPPEPPGRLVRMEAKEMFGPMVKDPGFTPGSHHQCLPDTLPHTDKVNSHSLTQQHKLYNDSLNH